ncbi:MAG: RDD family protein [Candidatus Acidiferrum sp.]
MDIDVSQPPAADRAFEETLPPNSASDHDCMYPVASMEERRIAGLIDAGCLLFAYGGFLALFGSLGGQFTFSKLSAAVCVATFVIVYLQYFALFTVFGGTTPGMMLRGLQVVGFSGEPPEPRQMLWRSAGYMLSASSFFMGFLWAMWDEDALTWHDRLSRTYLCPAPTFADMEVPHAAHSR